MSILRYTSKVSVGRCKNNGAVGLASSQTRFAITVVELAMSRFFFALSCFTNDRSSNIGGPCMRVGVRFCFLDKVLQHGVDGATWNVFQRGHRGTDFLHLPWAEEPEGFGRLVFAERHHQQRGLVNSVRVHRLSHDSGTAGIVVRPWLRAFMCSPTFVQLRHPWRYSSAPTGQCLLEVLGGAGSDPRVPQGTYGQGFAGHGRGGLSGPARH